MRFLAFGSALVAAALAASVFASPTFALEIDETPLGACDRLAADPADPDRIGDGVAAADVDPAAAEEGCRRALKLNPDDRHVLAMLGRVLIMDGRVEEAIVPLERAVELGSPMAMNYLGTVYWEGMRGVVEYPLAVEYFRQAADLGIVNAMLYVGTAYEWGLGVEQDLSAAGHYYRLAVAAGDSVARLYLADLLAEPDAPEADFAEAVALYRAVIEIDPARAPNAKNNLAYSWSQRGENLAEAERLALEALETMPADDIGLRSVTLDTLVAIRMQLGRLDEAFADAKAALALDATLIETWERLGDISLEFGHDRDALQSWQRALELYLANPDQAGHNWDPDALRQKIAEHQV